MSNDGNSPAVKKPSRFFFAYANAVVYHPVRVLLVIGLLLAIAGWGTSRLTINANQLDLISPDLTEVKDVKRLIDMIGGTGFLMLALRAEDESRMKATADDIAKLLHEDHENIRSVTYRVPVEFVQENMVLFMKTEDLEETKRRVNKFIRQQSRRSNPFFVQLRDAPAPTLDLDDIKQKYSHVGKKTILDDYYISEDRKMLMLLVKPLWDVNELAKTDAYLKKLNQQLAAYSSSNPAGTRLVEDYSLMGQGPTIAYGYTGSYKTTLDDSFAIASSLEPVSLWAFLGILAVTVVFFKFKWLPSLIVLVGVVIGTVLTMGFTYFTVGSLNMITSILGGILMGFGVDYGIHFVFRTRIELGQNKPYDIALRDALVYAGRPAAVAAVVTGGSFLVLMVSQFRGFSQFGFLAGAGTVIIGITMFSFSAAVLSLLGRRWPAVPERLVGKMSFGNDAADDLHIPHPHWVLAGCCAVVLAVCAFAVPWHPTVMPKDHTYTLGERLLNGVSFNYNTRALMAEDQHSIKLQDEIARRFSISADPVAIYTRTIEEAREVYDELTGHPEKYSTVDQVASIFSFVPPHDTAVRNEAVLAQWRQELDAMGVSAAMLPTEWQKHWDLITKILHAKPFTVDELPNLYGDQFRNLPETKPENRGYLTYVYPGVDLLDGAKMLAFNDQVDVITTALGKQYRSAGLTVLFGKLARIVLFDGKLTLLLATVWILLLHFLDFRSVTLALASVIPLGVGLLMMLGLLSITQHDLNFMNIIMLPILLGFGVSHGLYLLHRFLEGVKPVVALRSVGAAVASSTLTAMAGFASLFAASHNGLKSMGYVATVGLATTLLVSFTVLAAVLQLLYNRKHGR